MSSESTMVKLRIVFENSQMNGPKHTMFLLKYVFLMPSRKNGLKLGSTSGENFFEQVMIKGIITYDWCRRWGRCRVANMGRISRSCQQYIVTYGESRKPRSAIHDVNFLLVNQIYVINENHFIKRATQRAGIYLWWGLRKRRGTTGATLRDYSRN